MEELLVGSLNDGYWLCFVCRVFVLLLLLLLLLLVLLLLLLFRLLLIAMATFRPCLVTDERTGPFKSLRCLVWCSKYRAGI